MIRRALSYADRFLELRSQKTILFSCLALAILIGMADYRGTAGVLIVYLVPIALAAWYGERGVGIVIAVWCALAWFIQVTYISSSGVLDRAQVVTLLARLVTFCVIAVVIARLRSAMRLQKELSEFIVHDLRSPISSAITGLLTLKDSEESFSAIDREMIDLSLVSSQRALELVNSMLDLAKLESRSMTIEPTEVSVDQFSKDCIEPVELWAKGTNLKIEVESSLHRLRVDRNLTERVVINLLSNAIKFSPPDSTIVMKASASGDRNLHFSISDRGPGIPPEYVNSIFEPFSQVKGTKGGTGLGLTFCRLAIHAQKGKIWAESKVGSGTTFHFTIPNGVVD